MAEYVTREDSLARMASYAAALIHKPNIAPKTLVNANYERGFFFNGQPVAEQVQVTEARAIAITRLVAADILTRADDKQFEQYHSQIGAHLPNDIKFLWEEATNPNTHNETVAHRIDKLSVDLVSRYVRNEALIAPNTRKLTDAELEIALGGGRGARRVLKEIERMAGRKRIDATVEIDESIPLVSKDELLVQMGKYANAIAQNPELKANSNEPAANFIQGVYDKDGKKLSNEHVVITERRAIAMAKLEAVALYRDAKAEEKKDIKALLAAKLPKVVGDDWKKMLKGDEESPRAVKERLNALSAKLVKDYLKDDNVPEPLRVSEETLLNALGGDSMKQNPRRRGEAMLDENALKVKDAKQKLRTMINEVNLQRLEEPAKDNKQARALPEDVRAQALAAVALDGDSILRKPKPDAKLARSA